MELAKRPRSLLPALLVPLLALSLSTGVTTGDEGAGVFILQPQSQLAPINTNATFTCIVNETFLSKVVQDPLEWEVSGVRTSHEAFTPFSNSRRIFVSALEHLAGSLLTVAASVENNGIGIECVVYVEGERGGVEPVQSEMVYLTVYDRPSAPGNLSLAVLAPLQLQLSWTAPFSHPGVNLTYTINITALDQDNETEVWTVQSETVHNSTAYILRMDVPNCNWYQFIVTAANQAGASDPSDPITGILPMLPNTTDLSASLRHSVALQEEDGITCNISFQAATSCLQDVHPISSYTLLLVNKLTNSLINITHINTNAAQHTISLNASDGLEEDGHYTYHVVASNDVGEEVSVERELYTTDVSQVTTLLHYPNLTITCHFLQGTRALGCYVTLVATGNRDESFSERVRKTNSSLEAQAEFVLTQQPSCYTIEVYDWEEEDVQGRIPIPAETTGVEWSRTCNTAGGNDPTRDSGDSSPPRGYLLPVVASAVGGFILLAALLFMVALGIYCHHKTHTGQVGTHSNHYTIEHKICARNFSVDQIDSSSDFNSPISPHVLYDEPENCSTQAQESNGVCPQYSTLTRLPSTHSSHSSRSAHDPNYARLNALPEYACIEPRNAMTPSEKQMRPLPSIPDQPTYCEIVEKDEMVNSLPSAGTTV